MNYLTCVMSLNSFDELRTAEEECKNAAWADHGFKGYFVLWETSVQSEAIWNDETGPIYLLTFSTSGPDREYAGEHPELLVCLTLPPVGFDELLLWVKTYGPTRLVNLTQKADASNYKIQGASA